MKKAIVIFSLLAVSFAMVKCSPKANKATTATTTTTATEATPTEVATSTSTAPSAAQIESGKALYTNKCGTCHGLKDPVKYTQESWKHILKSMIPKAKLNEADGNLVTFYVMANAKQG